MTTLQSRLPVWGTIHSSRDALQAGDTRGPGLEAGREEKEDPCCPGQSYEEAAPAFRQEPTEFSFLFVVIAAYSFSKFFLGAACPPGLL